MYIHDVATLYINIILDISTFNTITSTVFLHIYIYIDMNFKLSKIVDKLILDIFVYMASV